MKYTCAEYRTEMILLGLKRRLQQEGLNEAERKLILSQIRDLEQQMEMD